MATIPCTVSRNIRIYNLTAGLTTLEFQAQAAENNSSLKYNKEYRNRNDFIQLFEFDVSSDRVKFTPDLEHILALGVYPPDIKVYKCAELGLKFKRRIDEVAVDVVTIGDDWRKLAILREDRYIELHTQGGIHMKTRIPEPARCLAYNGFSCDLLSCGTTSNVWRLNLEQGRFMAPLVTALESIDCMDINPVHYLYGFGGAQGLIELWDPRDRSKVASTVIANPRPGKVVDVTAFAFKQDGVHAAVGLSSGHAQLYDLRSTTPIFTVDHRYGLPVKRVGFHNKARKMVSMDPKVLKFWETDGELYTTITGEKDMTDFALCGDTGLVVYTGEQRRMQAKYIPDMGPAPRWLAYVDTITEEMEQTKDTGTSFASFKFVSREDLESMGLTALIGTKDLRPYMHGFFMKLRMYNEAMAIVKPVNYEDVRRQQIRKRLEKKRGDRITKLRKVEKEKKVTVNSQYARVLAGTPGMSRKRALAGKKIMKDSRFQELFSNPDFDIGSDDDQVPVGHMPQMFRPTGERTKLDETDSSEEEAMGQIVETLPDPEE